MSTAAATPNKWRKRLWRFTVISTLLGILLAVGVTIAAFFVVRMLFPIAAAGVHGMASANAHASTSTFYSGDSATRLNVLTQLKQTFVAHPTITFDNQTAAWILPAIEQCKTDSDPEVVALAEELAGDIKVRTTQPK